MRGRQSNVSFKRAQRLKVGDSVSMIAPSSSFSPEAMEFATAWLRRRGYKVRDFATRKESSTPYLAAPDAIRLRQYTKAWEAKETSALFCARGGYGAMHVAAKAPKIANVQKILMGMSDVTVLLNQVAQRFNQVTIHGPVLCGELFQEVLREKERDHLFSLLESPKEQILHKDQQYEVLQNGVFSGQLWGGNLSLVVASMGTPYEIVPTRKSILFLEDVHEPAYKLDRMFAQLAHAGFLQKFGALLLGDFTDSSKRIYTGKELKEIVPRFWPKGRPMLSGIGSSHVRMSVLLPIGGAIDIQKKIVQIPPLVR